LEIITEIRLYSKLSKKPGQLPKLATVEWSPS